MVQTSKPIKMVILGPKNDSLDPNAGVNPPWPGGGTGGSCCVQALQSLLMLLYFKLYDQVEKLSTKLVSINHTKLI
jgi:hypothetical protein